MDPLYGLRVSHPTEIIPVDIFLDVLLVFVQLRPFSVIHVVTEVRIVRQLRLVSFFRCWLLLTWTSRGPLEAPWRLLYTVPDGVWPQPYPLSVYRHMYLALRWLLSTTLTAQLWEQSPSSFSSANTNPCCLSSHVQSACRDSSVKSTRRLPCKREGV